MFCGKKTKFIVFILITFLVLVNCETKKITSKKEIKQTTVSNFNPPSAGTPGSPNTGTECKEENKKSKLITLIMTVLGSLYGLQRFYLGYIGLGVLMIVLGLLTSGIASFIWMIVDLVLIMNDQLPDALGCPLK
jgi:TM2 domain-containing membrane protein YozV